MRPLCLLLLSALSLLGSIPGSAQPPDDPGAAPELIVYLGASPHAPRVEDVVASVNERRPVPGVLGHGNPVRARFLLPYRATGESLEHLLANPDSPRAILERGLVLTYPPVVDLPGILHVLRGDPDVLSAGENTRLEVSAFPSDPLFANTGNPLQYQWGIHMLNLPLAWDRIKGSAYIGILDMGLEVAHPDLRAFSATGTYLGGNFRPHMSWDVAYNTANVNEVRNGQGPYTSAPSLAGHGTHVSGIVGATSNNNRGVVGTCWNCSLLMAKHNQFASQYLAGATWLVDHGVQVINGSFGSPDAQRDPCNPTDGTPRQQFCQALDFAEERGVLFVAASGNNKTDIDFPARDTRTIAVGGIRSTGAFWDDAGCTEGCGSNYTKSSGWRMQDLVAPAKDVLSTAYTGWDWITNPATFCGDGSVVDGYGLCTGTSMSTPFVSGIAGLIRSANPLLTRPNVRQILLETASRGTAWDTRLGYGIPNATSAVSRAMGTSAGQVIPNRLTPLFSLYSASGKDHLYTIYPQAASAAIFGLLVQSCDRRNPLSTTCVSSAILRTTYSTVGPLVTGYPSFPGINTVSPRASAYVFTSQAPPYAGAPPLVPLYRMSYNLKRTSPTSSDANVDVTYTTEPSGLTSFRSVGYELDGIEGYIYKRCTPEPQCIPPGAVRLYRLYHVSRDDYAIFPESELSQKLAEGYVSTAGLNDWIGYVYPNTDSDGDQLINGFETLLGTNPSRIDSDCDGRSDGVEVLQFPYGDPKGGPGCP